MKAAEPHVATGDPHCPRCGARALTAAPADYTHREAELECWMCGQIWWGPRETASGLFEPWQGPPSPLILWPSRSGYQGPKGEGK